MKTYSEAEILRATMVDLTAECLETAGLAARTKSRKKFEEYKAHCKKLQTEVSGIRVQLEALQVPRPVVQPEKAAAGMAYCLAYIAGIAADMTEKS